MFRLRKNQEISQIYRPNGAAMVTAYTSLKVFEPRISTGITKKKNTLQSQGNVEQVSYFCSISWSKGGGSGKIFRVSTWIVPLISKKERLGSV